MSCYSSVKTFKLVKIVFVCLWP